MSHDANQCRHAERPAPGVLAMVASLIAITFAQVLPALRRRPDLALPLLAALRALAVAAWGCRRMGAGHVPAARMDALRAAVLRLRDVLTAVVVDDGWGESGADHACAPERAPRAPQAAPTVPPPVRSALARDGPPLAA